MKIIFSLLISLTAASYLYAQESDTLTTRYKVLSKGNIFIFSSEKSIKIIIIRTLKKIIKLYNTSLKKIFNIFFKILFLIKLSRNFNLFKLKISPYFNWLQIINSKRVHNIISRNVDIPL